LQALTSPNIYSVSEWSWRVGGLNLTYWEAQIGIHVVFSVLVPIMLVNLLFPRHRRRPYLRGGGLVVTGIVAVAGVALVRFTIVPTVDAGYQAPTAALVGFVLAIVALAVLALTVLPK